MPGAPTSLAEVSHVSTHGLWLLLGDEELFLSFVDFPWFKDATIGELCDIEYSCARSNVTCVWRPWKSVLRSIMLFPTGGSNHETVL